MNIVLNIAAGKIMPLDIDFIDDRPGTFIVQLDKMYFNAKTPSELEHCYEIWKAAEARSSSKLYYVNANVFDFLGGTKLEFDHISCYRFLEHVTKPEIQGFIYLMSTALRVGGTVDIIVPNYRTLAQMIIDEKVDPAMPHADWEYHDTQLTYELLNEPSMPHASIWTPERIKYFFGLEQRFECTSLNSEFEFDGRNIYLRAQFKRVK